MKPGRNGSIGSEENMKRYKDNPPCYKCTDRAEGCHGRCERFADWKEKQQAETAQINEAKKHGGKAEDFLIDGTFRRRRHHERRKKK